MTVSSLVCAPRCTGASSPKSSRTIEASVMPRFIASLPRRMALILSAGSASRQTRRRREPGSWRQTGRLAEEQLAGLEPGLGRECQRLHVDALVVAVEASGHRLGGQRARKQTEP